MGTYTGTYTFPSAGDGPFIMRVQSDGTATGVLNEGNFDQMITAAGTVNLATGQVSLTANFDNSATNEPSPATITITGTASASGATGPLVLNESGSTETGSFATTKTSPSPTAVPTPAPLVKRKSSGSLRKKKL